VWDEDGRVHETTHALTVQSRDIPPPLAGAWVDIYHHDEAEAVPFNRDLAALTDADWEQLIESMADVGQKVVVVSSVFHHLAHRTRHDFDETTYPGAELYPSELYPRRWAIAATDPVEAILRAADRRGMSVFLGVGFFAFFDYSAAALRWAKEVMGELWRRYGHHRSLYGWYFAHEQCGGLYTPGMGGAEEQREEMISYVSELTALARQLSPHMYTLLATNTFGVGEAVSTYRRLLPSLDILCPFGYHRMPEGDLTESDVVSLLSSLCAETGTHLWADLETFGWPLVNGAELHPRPFTEVRDDLQRLRRFEAILHFQFPGLMASPQMRIAVGGEPAVALYRAYQQYALEIGI